MAMGQIGLFTTAIETLATTVGAGLLLGGFLAGSVGMAAGWPRRVLDKRTLAIGYGGGAVGILFALVDAILRYAR